MRSLPLLAVLLLACHAAAAAAEKPSPEVKKLMEERVEVLKRAVKLRQQELQGGRATAMALVKVARRLLKAELSLATGPTERIAAHERYYKVVCAADDRTVVAHKAGLVPLSEALDVRAERCTAEIDLRRAGGKPPKDSKPPRKIELPPEK